LSDELQVTGHIVRIEFFDLFDDLGFISGVVETCPS